MHKNSVIVGGRLLFLREETGLTKVKISKTLNMTDSNYGRIEKGKQMLSYDSLEILYRNYRWDPSFILNGKQTSIESQFFLELQNQSEPDKKNLLRILYLLMEGHKYTEKTLQVVENKEDISLSAFHLMFGSNLMESIENVKGNVIPYVLHYEMQRRNLTKEEMIALLGTTYEKFVNAEKIDKAPDLDFAMKMHDSLGYDATFLLFNEIRATSYFDLIWNKKEIVEKQNLLQMFRGAIRMKEYPGIILGFEDKDKR